MCQFGYALILYTFMLTNNIRYVEGKCFAQGWNQNFMTRGALHKGPGIFDFIREQKKILSEKEVFMIKQ